MKGIPTEGGGKLVLPAVVFSPREILAARASWALSFCLRPLAVPDVYARLITYVFDEKNLGTAGPSPPPLHGLPAL